MCSELFRLNTSCCFMQSFLFHWRFALFDVSCSVLFSVLFCFLLQRMNSFWNMILVDATMQADPIVHFMLYWTTRWSEISPTCMPMVESQSMLTSKRGTWWLLLMEPTHPPPPTKLHLVRDGWLTVMLCSHKQTPHYWGWRHTRGVWSCVDKDGVKQQMAAKGIAVTLSHSQPLVKHCRDPFKRIKQQT